jgi:hypothetical protein
MLHKVADLLIRNIASFALLVIGVFGITNGAGWLCLLSLSLLATKAILPKGNNLVLWPIGLFAVIGTSYIGYVFLWVSNKPGVSYDTARQLFLVQYLLFAAIAVLRNHDSGERTKRLSARSVWFTIVLTGLPVLLVIYATYELIENPVGLIGSYFAGGDHLNHSGMIYDLTQWTAGSGMRSPLDIYAVPNGLHFLISNVVGISSLASSTPPLAQVFLSAAWFEWLQVAAFVQLGLVVIIGKRNQLWLFRALVAFAIILIMMSIDLLVLHLMWSGFSTSLAITWLLLVPVVALIAEADQKVSKSGQRFTICLLFAMSSIAWILYQPFAIPFFVIASFLVVGILLARFKVFKNSGYKLVSSALPLVTAVCTYLIVLIPYWASGSENSFMARLSTNGESYRTSFYLVLFVVVLSIWILWFRSEDESSLPMWGLRRTLLSMQCGIVALVVAAITVVVLSGKYGIINQPYYTQKMLWILLLTSVPLVVGGVLNAGSTWMSSLVEPQRRALIIALPTLLFLTPIALGKYPVLATQHSSFPWFAKAVRVPVDMDPEATVAFAPNDPQGTFISNLALSIISKNSLDLNIALSGNQYLACRFIGSRPISVVYTTKGGKDYLRDSGCPPELLYFEEDIRTDTYRRSHPRLGYGILSALESSPSLSEYLDSGFHGSERWVRWSTGLRSTISFSIDVEQAGSNIVFGYLAPDALPRPIMAVFTVNGVATKKLSVEQLSSGEVLIPITRETQESGVVNLQIDCDWSDEEIQSLNLVASPPKCLGIRYLGISIKK